MNFNKKSKQIQICVVIEQVIVVSYKMIHILTAKEKDEHTQSVSNNI